ncbi:hypothetical protein LSAT2_017951 [Lamellibrachia satsuma]|nr:hypothetical protein LSAT2_017951 [Lamellibrachia satsuma]
MNSHSVLGSQVNQSVLAHLNTKAPEEGSGSKSASLKSTTVNVDVNRHWFPCIDPISHTAADAIVWRARSDNVDCHEMFLQVLRGRGTAINTTDRASAGGRGCQGKNTTTLAEQSIKEGRVRLRSGSVLRCLHRVLRVLGGAVGMTHSDEGNYCRNRSMTTLAERCHEAKSKTDESETSATLGKADMISPDTERLIERGGQKSGRDETEFVPNGDQPETGAVMARCGFVACKIPQVPSS